MKLSEKETATILAALRHYQATTEEHERLELEFEHFANIDPLSDDEIDLLCEKLNLDE